MSNPSLSDNGGGKAKKVSIYTSYDTLSPTTPVSPGRGSPGSPGTFRRSRLSTRVDNSDLPKMEHTPVSPIGFPNAEHPKGGDNSPPPSPLLPDRAARWGPVYPLYPSEEKELRAASRLLYRHLTKGKDPTSRQEYQAVVKRFASSKRELRFLRRIALHMGDASHITEDMFIDCVSRQMRNGHIDPLEDEAEFEAFENADIKTKMIHYPGAFITTTIDSVVDYLTTDGVSLLFSLIPLDQMQLLLMFFIVSLLSFKLLVNCGSVIVFYICVSVLLVTSFQMFKTRRKQKEVSVMSQILRMHNPCIEPEFVVANFVTNSIRPYWTFLVALFVIVPAFYLSHKSWIMCSELAMLSWGMSIGMFIYIVEDKRNNYAYFAIIFNILASLPHILHGLPEIPVLHYLVIGLTSNLFSVPVFGRIHLNFGIPSIAYIALPTLFCKLAINNSWQALFRTLLPQLVSLIWWQLGIAFFIHATWYGIIFGSVGWFGFFSLLPYNVLVLFAGSIVYLFQSASIYTIIKLVVTLLLVLIAVSFHMWRHSGFSIGPLTLRGKPLKVKLLVIVLLLAAVGALVVIGSSAEEEEENAILDWKSYSNLCSKPAWDKSNVASVEIACRRYKYMEVNWTGVVRDVTLTEVDNPAYSLFESLPMFIAEKLKCIYGKPYPAVVAGDSYALDAHEKASKLGKTCHLDSLNTYTFKLLLEMEVDGGFINVPFTFNNDFRTIMLALKPTDIVSIYGTLIGNVGGRAPIIEPIDITWMSRDNDVIHSDHTPDQSTTEMYITRRIRRTWQETFNFFASPFLEYKTVKRQRHVKI